MDSKQSKQAKRRKHTTEFRAGAVRLVLEELSHPLISGGQTRPKTSRMKRIS